MKKKHFGNCLCFLLIFVVFNGLTGPSFFASASSGSHVFRASVAPKPEQQPAPAGTQSEAAQDSAPASATPEKAATPPAAAAEPAAKKAATAPKASTKKAKASSAKAAVTAKKSTKAAGKSQPDKKAVKKTTAKKTTAKKKSAAKVAKAPVASKAIAQKTKAPSVRKAAVKVPTSGDGGLSTTTASAKDLHLNVKSAILINMSNGKVYYEHNPDKTIAPASITKLLTLYLVREAMAQGRLSPTTSIPVSPKAVRTGGSRMSLKRGEKVPLNELIKGISVVSANNACVAVAEFMGKGDPSKFVSQMNAKAKKIGMTSSLFKNPNGLPASGQLSTARDIAKLSMSYLRTFPESLTIHSMTTHTYHGATHRNANSLLRTYKGVDGLKTGFVSASGYNITATAKRGNTRLLAVVLGAQNSVVRQVETAKLLDYGFKRAAMEDNLGNRAAADAQKPKV